MPKKSLRSMEWRCITWLQGLGVEKSMNHVSMDSVSRNVQEAAPECNGSGRDRTILTNLMRRLATGKLMKMMEVGRRMRYQNGYPGLLDADSQLRTEVRCQSSLTGIQ